MNILLDTHLAIWVLYDDRKLSLKARNIIINPDNTIFYSVISTWEVLLKHSNDPDNMSCDSSLFLIGCKQANFYPVNLSDRHISAIETLSCPDAAPVHKDPFDKLLLAQAKTENMLFLTHDTKLMDYDEPYVILV